MQTAPIPHRSLFFWTVVGLGTVLSLVFMAGIVILLRHAGEGRRFGWSAEGGEGGAVAVTAVEPDGPAAARLSPGDRVRAVDGDRRVNGFSLEWLLHAVPPGSGYALTVERGGREIEVPLATTREDRSSWRGTALVRLFVAVVLCSTGLVVGLWRPDDRVARLYTLTVLLSAPVFFANPLLLRPLRDAVLSLPEALVVWLARVHSPFHGAVGFHFALEFPDATARHGRGWRAAKWLFYAWAALVCAFYNAGYFGLVVSPEPLVRLTWAHAGLWRSLFILDSLFGPVIFAAIPAAIIRNARAQTSPHQRRRLRWALFGAIVGFTPVFLLFLSRFVDEILLSRPTLPPPLERAADNVAFLMLTAAPVTLAYAVVKHRVFGIRIVVRRGLQHLLARNVLRAVLLLPLALLVGSVLADPHRTVAEILFEHPAHLALIAAAALSLHFRGRLTAWIDRRFFREAYQQEQILLSLVEDIRARDSLADLSRLVIERLGESLHPERVYLAYQRMDGRDFGIEFSSDGDAAGLQIADDAELIRRLETRPHAQELPAAEPDDAALRWLAELRVTLAVPMMTPAGRLVGCILLGEKKSEQPYSHADKKLLEAMASQMAILYENAALKRKVEQEARVRRDVLSRLAHDSVNLVKECPRCRACYDRTAEVCPEDRTDLVLTLPVERTIAGKYRLERRLGVGGMGAVYEATDLGLGRRVAVKIMVTGESGDTALRRFEREARAAARLRHRNIVTIYDYGAAEPEGAYLAMELLEGTTLRWEIRRRGALPPPLAAEWFDQVLDGIEAAHAAGVVHRDLKPENVMVVPEAEGPGLVKILDFGLAKLTLAEAPEPRTLTVPGTVLGTLSYMSPEQLSGHPVDMRADVFSLGVLVTETVTGSHPFRGSTATAVVAAILHDAFHLEGESAEARALDAVLQRCLAKDPTARYASVADLRDPLLAAIRNCPPFPAVPQPLRGDESTLEDSEGLEM